MERRKFLAGVGSLAAGSAAAMGTGAFTSVSANRSLSVAVADDSAALLSIDDIDGAANSEYVDTTGDGVSIDVSTDAGGDGLNNNAKTKIKNILRIENQGTQEVYAWAENLPSDPRVALAVQPSSQIQNAGTGAGENQGAFSSNSNLDLSDLDDDEGSGGEEAAPLLAPGDYVDIELFAYGDLSGLNFDGQIQIKALDADEA